MAGMPCAVAKPVLTQARCKTNEVRFLATYKHQDNSIEMANTITVPYGVIGWHITSGKHVWIDSIIGGYVEDDDKGGFFTAEQVQEALNHRSNHIRALYANYRRV